MKILNKILILAAIAVSAVSCDLTLLPEDEVTPKQYFATESDLALWSNKFYNYLLETADVGINDADDKIDNGLSNFIAGSRNPASESWSFSQLREINYLLEHLDQCTDRGVALKYEAVARFFRAYFYFVKVRAYGDVPYYDHVLASNDPDLFRARDDRGYVMDKVLEDFDFAAKNLPSSWGTKSTRVTKWAALAYASRAALFEGTFRRYHAATLFKNDDKNAEKAEKYLRIAVDCAAEFIASAPYSLYNTGDEPYRDLFWADDAKTTEVVLCRRYDAGAGVTHSVPQSINFGRTRVDDLALDRVLTNDNAASRIILGVAPVNQYTQEVRDTVKIRHLALELRTVLQSNHVCAGWNCGASIDLLLALARNPARGIRTTIGKFTNNILDSVTEKCAVYTEVADSIFRPLEFAS